MLLIPLRSCCAAASCSQPGDANAAVPCALTHEPPSPRQAHCPRYESAISRAGRRGPGCSPVGTGGFKLLGPFFFKPNFQDTSSQKLVSFPIKSNEAGALPQPGARCGNAAPAAISAERRGCLFVGPLLLASQLRMRLFHGLQQLKPACKPMARLGRQGRSQRKPALRSINPPACRWRPACTLQMRNTHSWSKAANLLFIDTPLFTGFSRSSDNVTDRFWGELEGAGITGLHCLC